MLTRGSAYKGKVKGIAEAVGSCGVMMMMKVKAESELQGLLAAVE